MGIPLGRCGAISCDNEVDTSTIQWSPDFQQGTPAMQTQQLRSYCLRIVLWFLLMLVGGCLFFRYVPSLLNDGSVTGTLRGSQIINFRQSNSDQEIAIYDTGNAARYRFAAASTTPSRDVKLTRPVFEAVIVLRSEWCTTPPQFRIPNKTEVVYEVGLLCGTFKKRRIIISSALVPVPVKNLLAEVPPLP